MAFKFQFKKFRILLAWMAAPVLITYANMTDRSFRWGAILVVMGELIRIWSLGFLERKGKKLAMNGPYSLVRNPLYCGNFLIGAGIAVVCWNWWIALLFLIGFGIVYAGTIRDEQKTLKTMFGSDFEIYCKNVPSFIPRLTPYRAPEKDSFQWQRIIKHHEYVTILGITLLLFGIHLYDKLVLEKEHWFHEKHLVIGTFIVVLLLLLERLFISRLHKTLWERLLENFQHPPFKK